MKRTDRGFRIYAEFTEYYKNKVKVIESSLAEKRCVWIFCQHPTATVESTYNGVPIPLDTPVLLTEFQAKKLIAALTKFIEGK